MVLDVLSLHRTLTTTGMAGRAPLATLLPTDPPHHLWIGLQHYAFVLAKVRENDDAVKAEREKTHGATA